MGKLKYIPSVDGLRAFAILSVLLFHFFPELLPFGFLGVDVFFVISGFLITLQLASFKSANHLRNIIIFYKRRIMRLFPALFVCVTLVLIVFSQFFLSIDFRKVVDSAVATFTFWSNVYFWRDGGYFGGDDKLKPLLHMWSLSIEQQFYICFPLFFSIGLVVFRRTRFSIFIYLVCATIISFLIWIFLHHIGGANPAFFLLPSRFWQFGFGAIAALITINRNNLHNFKLAPIVSNFSLIFLLGTILVAKNDQLQTIYATIATCMILVFVDVNSISCRILKLHFFQMFGKISYSVYLYHWPLAVALNYYFVSSTPFVYSVSFLGASILLGWCSYSLIEDRFRSHYKFKGTLVLIILCSLISVGVVRGANNNSSDGFIAGIAQASGSHFRCDLASYYSFGASRACALKRHNTGDGTVVLLGNSHAQMYSPLIIDVIPDNFDLTLVPLNHCLPTTVVNISFDCIRKAEANKRAVLSDDEVKMVLIGMTWDDLYYLDQDEKIVDRGQLITAVDQLLTDIIDSKKIPVIISPIPVPNKNLSSLISRQLHFDHINENEAKEALRINKRDFLKQFEGVNNFFKSKYGDQYILAFEDLCDELYCYYGRDNLFYFADATHLSKVAVPYLQKTRDLLKKNFEKLE